MELQVEPWDLNHQGTVGLENSKPLARLMEANKIIFFMIFFCKYGLSLVQKIVFNGHSHKDAL
jgi:hypothetical protein